jgi:hypothetical protein
VENPDSIFNVEDEDSRFSASAMDTSSQSMHEISSVLQIDEQQLLLIEKDLLKLTKDLAVEPLERLFCHLMEYVRRFKHRYDRTNLIEMMRSRLPPDPKLPVSSNTSSPNRKSGRI